jgi:hypothetical protein
MSATAVKLKVLNPGMFLAQYRSRSNAPGDRDLVNESFVASGVLGARTFP